MNQPKFKIGDRVSFYETHYINKQKGTITGLSSFTACIEKDSEKDTTFIHFNNLTLLKKNKPKHYYYFQFCGAPTYVEALPDNNLELLEHMYKNYYNGKLFSPEKKLLKIKEIKTKDFNEFSKMLKKQEGE